MANNAEMRKLVFSKTNGFCGYCGEPLLPGWHVDHIIPKHIGGTNTVENKIPSCASCNIRKSINTPDEFKLLIKTRLIKKLDNAVRKDLYYLSSYLGDLDCEEILGDYMKLVEKIEAAPISFYYERDK